jgi:hypothetical protein
MVLLVSLSIAVWLWLLLGRGGFWLADQRLGEIIPAPPDWPEVVAIIPARGHWGCRWRRFSSPP